MRLSVFDLDGTLVAGDSHVALLRARLFGGGTPAGVRAEIVVGGLLWSVGVLGNRWTKAVAARALARREVVELERFGVEWVLPRVRPALARRVREDRAAGFTTMLLSASLEPVIAAVGRALEFDVVAGTRVVIEDGRVAGAVDGEALHGAAKAEHLRSFARAHGADLARSRGYGDSHSDRWFLELVGEAHAVRPDRRLRRIAAARGWAILDEV